MTHSMIRRVLSFALLLLALSSCGTSGSSTEVFPSSTFTPSPTVAPNQPVLAALLPIKTVFLILMESYPWSAVRGYPYISKLTSQIGAYATQYYKPPGTVLLSLPQYIWLEAGDSLGITTDDDPSTVPQTTTSHLTTQLTAAGISWKEYAEGISGTNCPLADSGKYAVRHNPFVYFADVTENNDPTSANCIAHVRPYTELARDLTNNTVSRYNFITPDLCDDMHDPCSSDPIGQGDTWLSQQVPIIMNSQAYKSGGAIFITWDNSDYSAADPIGMIVLSPYIKAVGYSNSIHYDHSSMLKTMEEIFGVPLIRAAADPSTNDLSDFFVTPLATPVPTATPPSTPINTPATPQAFLPVVTRDSSGVTTVSIDLTHPAGTSIFGTGATHTQDSEEAYFNGYPGVAAYYQNSLYYQNVFLMGWGMSNPEPSPGSYDFSTQDSHVQLMQQTGAHSIFSLCCAPGWMRPAGYQDDWAYLATAPAPTHVTDFANLSAMAAKRYPGVRIFQVWNELKGMLGTDPGCTPSVCGQDRWDYERYTTLYNAVWDAVKAVRPDAKLGGPYVVMDYQYNPSNVCGTYGCIDQRDLDVITYWLANKHGADYIVLDGGPNFYGNNDFDATYFSSIVEWMRQQPGGGATLPIVWAEWYPAVSQLNGNLDYYNAVYASDAIQTVKAGVQWALMWGTTGGVGGQIPETDRPELMLDYTGEPTKVYDSTLLLQANFPPGTQWYNATASPSTVTVLASSRKTMLVNQLNAAQNVSVNGTQLSLSPYQVTVINTPNSGT